MTYTPTLISTTAPEDTNAAAWNKVNANLENIAIGIADTVKGLDYQDSVLDQDLTAPPVSPSEGNRYIVKAVATGAWSGHETEIAQYMDSAWEFIEPNTGSCLTVEDELIMYVFNGSSWVSLPSLADAITGTAGEILSQYSLVYPSAVDGKFYLATAAGTEIQSNAIGIVTQSGGIAQDSSGQIQVNPIQIINGAWAWTPNTELFLNTAGGMTHDASALAWTKPVGYAITATKILFAPQTGWSNNPWLELDGDQLGIEYVPVNYTRTETGETSADTQLSRHLAGIDAKLAEIIAMIPS